MPYRAYFRKTFNFVYMNTAESIIGELRALASEEKRLILSRFFKTGPGEYGEGDMFIGVTVPKTRSVARTHVTADSATVDDLLASPWHEARLCALLIMVSAFGKADAGRQKALFDFYLAHTDRINNWDLVDLSAPTIVGGYLADKPRETLYRLANSQNLWEARIAMVSTMAFIRNGDLDDTYKIATMLMTHKHDLMHKACGWMLREAGKHDKGRLYAYIDLHRARMPRTMLRYAIERFTPDERKALMARTPTTR